MAAFPTPRRPDPSLPSPDLAIPGLLGPFPCGVVLRSAPPPPTLPRARLPAHICSLCLGPGEAALRLEGAGQVRPEPLRRCFPLDAALSARRMCFHFVGEALPPICVSLWRSMGE
jgi:hypothetical protein